MRKPYDRSRLMIGILPRGLDTDPPMARAQSDSYDLPLDRTFAIGRGRSVIFTFCLNLELTW